ncbi:acetyltransferase [Phenylobacterium sp.]|uniref:acetyltransferase n=1 Tax=Phenylobacterium sp. TaxID=1871053 RepID=UPI0027202130|nr:acetyltransferase [Phenylobacterium sp.]MDO8379604.1 acetyltransferase [Phenylobacterium sp.]
MKPIALVAARAETLPRIIIDACAAADRPIAGLVQVGDEAQRLKTHLPVLGGEDLLSDPAFLSAYDIFVAIGDGRRKSLSEAVLARGGTVATVIHPAATVSASAKIGVGTVISAGVIVQMDATVGRYCSLNTACTVDHDNVLADGVNIAPGAHLAGGVQVGEGAFIGIGATIKGWLRIGARATVGAGAVVLKEVPDGVTVVGNPARPMVAKS